MKGQVWGIRGIKVADWIGIDIEDAAIAIQAAQSMAEAHQRDVAILTDLRTIFVEYVGRETILEVVRYDRKVHKGQSHGS